MFIVFSPVDVEVGFSDQLTVFSKKRSAISRQLSVSSQPWRTHAALPANPFFVL
jgi:hypothetical protein